MKHQELIDRYMKGSAIVSEALQSVTPAILDKVPAPGKWSIRQNLLHLLDAELINAGRLRMLAAQPGCNIVAWDQNRWAADLHYEKQSADEVLAVLRGVRSTTANMLRALEPENWDNTGTHPQRGEMTLVSVLELAITHCESHARTIRELRDRFTSAAVA